MNINSSSSHEEQPLQNPVAERLAWLLLALVGSLSLISAIGIFFTQ